VGMCVCVRVCVYVHVCVCVHTHTHTHIDIWVNSTCGATPAQPPSGHLQGRDSLSERELCVRARVCVCVGVRACVRVCVCLRTCVYACRDNLRCNSCAAFTCSYTRAGWGEGVSK